MTNQTLFKTIVGSHVWGMETPVSDIDIFKAYIAPTYDILIGKQHRGSHFSQNHKEDITSTEIGTIVTQLLKNNISYITYIYSPHVLCGNNVLNSLRTATSGNISKLAYNSIHGMSLSNYKKYIVTNKDPSPKRLNTIARVLQFGINLFDNEKIEFHPTHVTTPEEIEELLNTLTISHSYTNLSEKPSNPHLLENWIYEMRLNQLTEFQS